MAFKISITGPESSGKTALSNYLSEAIGGVMVDEFARAYLSAHARETKLEDLEAICAGQLAAENEASATNGIVVCDTDFTVLKIWAEVVFGKIPTSIEKAFQNQNYDLILLCKPDLPWEPDPLRTMPIVEDRMRLFEKYCRTLDSNNFPFHIVEGQGTSRGESALEIVRRFI